jgi:hypothetical protein
VKKIFLYTGVITMALGVAVFGTGAINATAQSAEETYPQRVSVASDGTEGDRESLVSYNSVNRRFVAFASYATNLVPGDTNRSADIFVHDRETGITERVSVASDGTEGNNQSYAPSISADGRFVAFDSESSNLVPGDTNSFGDTFVHDRETGLTERVSIASDGTEGNSFPEVPSISADGRFVAFYSFATNLVPGDTNRSADIFVHDRETGLTKRVSVASDGTEGNSRSESPSISADGRFVAFFSYATNLVPGDTNNVLDVFITINPLFDGEPLPEPPEENQPPTITLLGDNPLTITQGDPFVDPGATAHDLEDGDISDQITVSGVVETSVVGTIKLTYSVADSEGLPANPQMRSVIVNEAVVENHPPTLSFPAAGPYVGDGINPNDGDTDTLFSFNVIYTDSDNDKPEYVKVCVEGIADDLSTVNTCITEEGEDGIDYTAGVEMLKNKVRRIHNPGTYEYYFEASDGTEIVRFPKTNRLPLVVKVLHRTLFFG